MMTKTKFSTLLILLLVSFNLFASDEPLLPEEAFKFEAQVKGDVILGTWTPANDYYMYRDKFNFQSDTPGIQLGTAKFPKGKLKHGIKPDGTDGEVEVFTAPVTIEVPFTRSDNSVTQLALTAGGQGCADKLGLCYPPQKRPVTLTLAAADTTAANPFQQGGSAVQNLSAFSDSIGAGAVDEPLDPKQAFALDANIKDNAIYATWVIADDYYMYREKFQFETSTAGVTLGTVELPKGKLKHGITPDGNEGEVETYEKQVTIKIPFTVSDPNIQNIALLAKGQGCAEKLGICYPPQKRPLNLNLQSGTASATTADNSTAAAPVSQTQTATDTFVSEQDQSSQILASGNTLKIIAYFFLGGLALAFTACMYPMIPILSSIIVGQGEKVTTVHAFNLSVVYVLSMAVTFGVMGALFAGLAQGVNIQAYFQNPWVLIAFSALFIALAMSMFGFYNIQMPAGLQGKLSEVSNHQKGGTFIGVVIMGVLSALIVGPCAGPVLIGALAYAASVGDAFLGFLSMFVLGVGLGTPLLFVGTSHGKFLPKAGSWMDTVKYAAGVILLAIALVFLGRVSFVSSKLVMLLWATLFIVAGVYMGALEQIKEGASKWFRLWKGLGIAFMLYGAIVMLGGLTGARNVNDPLHGSALVSGGGAHPQAELGFKRIKTADELQRELDTAKATGKYVMLDFYADWCTYCKEFEDYVFTHAEVQTLLSDFVLLQADVTANDVKDQGLLKKVGVIAPPAILFWAPNGEEKKKFRIVGSMNAKQFIDRVNLILKGN